MEMTRPGGNRGNSQPEGRPSPGAWKPAQNAGSHISTATTAAGLLSGKKSNPAKIVGSVRFLHRTAILLRARLIALVTLTRLLIKVVSVLSRPSTSAGCLLTPIRDHIKLSH